MEVSGGEGGDSLDANLRNCGDSYNIRILASVYAGFKLIRNFRSRILPFQEFTRFQRKTVSVGITQTPAERHVHWMLHPVNHYSSVTCAISIQCYSAFSYEH
jgi:hypothetical protein